MDSGSLSRGGKFMMLVIGPGPFFVVSFMDVKCT